jgi:predicted MFS family arabinose efflux permease
MATTDASGGASSTTEVEIQAFVGRPSQKVDLADPAPFGFRIAIALGLVALVDRADSALVGGVLPTLQEYFGISDFTAGILLSAPSVAALLLVVPAGRLADTRNRKALMAIVILSWGLLTFGAAAAPTFGLFLLARILLGIATPLNIPATASMLGDLYRSQARTKAFAVVRVMEYLGFPLGVALGGVIGGLLGWRAAFLFMGIPAVLLAGAIALWLREPRRGLADELTVRARDAGVTMGGPDGASTGTSAAAPDQIPEETAAIKALTEPGAWARAREALRIPTLRWTVLGQALLFAGFTGLFSFAPTFFFRVQGLPEGAAAGISGGVGLLGLMAGGILAARIGDRYHMIRPGWRVLVSGVALTCASLGVLVYAGVTILWVQIVVFLLINFANIVALANLGAVQADVIPARLRGTGFATAQFLVTIGSSFGALIVGTISAIVIRRSTEVTQDEVNAAQEALDQAQESGAGDAAVAAAQAAFDQLDAVFGQAQALGIRWGVASLFVVLIAGSLTIFRARATYEADAQRVLDEAAAR